MTTERKRVAINLGGGYVPGLNAVVSGTVLAASELGWEVIGIRDGFEGLLFPDRYPDGGLVKLTLSVAENLTGATGCILGTGSRTDPFRVRTTSDEDSVKEEDRSDELIEKIRAQKIDALISVVGTWGLGILWKLSRKGLKTVCVPKSVENDVAATMLSFGYNSALGFMAEMLDRARQAAASGSRIGVVEVLGKRAGWLALQAGMAVCADAVLIPEIPYDLQKVAAKLQEKSRGGRTSGLVVVAEGAKPLGEGKSRSKTFERPMAGMPSPVTTGEEEFHATLPDGRIAQDIALEIQKLTGWKTFPLVLVQLARGGTPSVIDRQLGLGYGAGAVWAVRNDQSGVMVVYQPPDLKFVPLSYAVNKVRTVPADSEFVQIVRALGISLGD